MVALLSMAYNAVSSLKYGMMKRVMMEGPV